MNTNFSLPRGAESVHHTYDIVLPSDKKSPPKVEEPLNTSPPAQPSTRLQRARLTSQDVAQPFFEKVKSFFHPHTERLKGSRFSLGAFITSMSLNHVTEKVAQIKNQNPTPWIREEKPQEYLQVCLRNLKDNFNQFYLKITQERPIIKRPG